MYELIVTAVAVLCFLGFALLLIKDKYLDKVLIKFGLKENSPSTNWTAFSWESCLQKLEHEVDVVFFGDSLVRGGDFHKAFPDKKIVNLGLSGDTLGGMRKRVSMVKSLSPKKVFFLGGINGLTNFNGKKCIETYEKLITDLEKALPEAEIYLHSVLPLSKQKQKCICNNKKVELFNSEIERLAEKHGHTFVNLYPLYLVDGSLDATCTKDGIHLLPEAYEKWYESIAEYMK